MMGDSNAARDVNDLGLWKPNHRGKTPANEIFYVSVMLALGFSKIINLKSG